MVGDEWERGGEGMRWLLAAWRRGWNLLVISWEKNLGVYSIFGETVFGEKQKMFPWGEFRVPIEDVSQLSMANVLFLTKSLEGRASNLRVSYTDITFAEHNYKRQQNINFWYKVALITS